MNIPGFTAEAALYNVGARYQASAGTVIHGGLVRPALSDRIDLYLRLPCLKWTCIDRPPWLPHCWQTIGFWNHVTGRCE